MSYNHNVIHLHIISVIASLRQSTKATRFLCEFIVS